MILHRLAVVAVFAVLFIQAAECQAAPDDVAAEPKPANPAFVQQIIMDDANFESNVFNPHGNARQARARLESMLKLRINELDQICNLSDAQRNKLKFAATVDMKRFFDEVDTLKRKYRNGKQDQLAWNEVWQQIQPLQTRLAAGLFGDNSFFTKTLRTVLSEDQFAKYEVASVQRKRFRYRASLEVALASIENTVPLRHTQHEAIVRLLLDDKLPPMSLGKLDQHVVMYRIARLPEHQLKPLLDDVQWNQLQEQIRRSQAMEQVLIQNGLVAKDEIVAMPKVLVRRRAVPPELPVDATRPENQLKTVNDDL